jgi:hypothetical protein
VSGDTGGRRIKDSDQSDEKQRRKMSDRLQLVLDRRKWATDFPSIDG